MDRSDSGRERCCRGPVRWRVGMKGWLESLGGGCCLRTLGRIAETWTGNGSRDKAACAVCCSPVSTLQMVKLGIFGIAWECSPLRTFSLIAEWLLTAVCLDGEDDLRPGPADDRNLARTRWPRCARCDADAAGMPSQILTALPASDARLCWTTGRQRRRSRRKSTLQTHSAADVGRRN